MARARKTRVHSLADAAWQRGDLRTYARLLKQGARTGDPTSMYDLALQYEDGLRDRAGAIIIGKSPKLAARLMRTAAELGNSDAMVGVGRELFRLSRRARGAKRRILAKEALEWERRARAAGNEMGAYNFAQSHLLAHDFKKAVRAFRYALARGDIDALLQVAHAELFGLGTKRNVPAAIRKLKAVATTRRVVTDFDREFAMLTLALIHYAGWLVPRRFDVMLYWLRRGAKQGSAAASGLLADLGESESPRRF